MILPQIFDFTQSKLQDYVDCPYRFYMRYIRQIKWPALVVDDALEFELRSQAGARFHHLVQQYLLGMPESRLSDMAAADPIPEMSNWLDGFLNYVPSLLESDRHIETLLTTNLSGQRMLAKYDLILVQDNGTLLIYDWKTSRKPARKEWLLERIQTRFYRFLLTQAGSIFTNEKSIIPEQITMAYWFAASPETPVFLPYNPSMYNADKDFFSRLISEIMDKEVYERTSDVKKCRYCVYRSHCDRGIDAGNLDAYDDFTIEADDFDIDLDFESIDEIKF